ncbi:ribonuclease H-like domain-containing protein [Tanacetum coccineum]
MKELKSTYAKVDGFVIFNLLQKISSIKQGGSSVADYYHILNSLWREFDALTKLPTCTCDANKELGLHNQLMKLMQFFMGLDDCYQSVRSALLTRDPFLEVKDAYTTISMEESHRGISEPSNVTESKINATSFAAKGGPNPNLFCKNCGMIGHTIERCYELIGYPPGFKKVANPIKQSGFQQSFNLNSDVKSNEKQQSSTSQSSSSSSFTPEHMRKLLSLINGNDLKKEITLGTSSEFGGLYLFDMEPDNNIGKVNMVVSCYVSKDLWQNRLGHPADQVLNVLKYDLNLTMSTSVSACEVCLRAKQTRDPFPLSNHKSKKLGELIHLDL